MREIASRICRDYLTGAWKTISASDLQLKRIRWISIFLFGFVVWTKNHGNWTLINSIDFFILKSFSGGLSNFLYYVSLPDDLDACNNVKSVKRARKDTTLQEPKEVREIFKWARVAH